MLCHDEAHNVYKSKVRYFFPKKSPSGASLVQNYATLYLMIVCKDFLKHFIMMKQKMCSKVTLFNFTKNILFLGLKGNLCQIRFKVMQPYISSLHSPMTLTYLCISSYGMSIVINL